MRITKPQFKTSFVIDIIGGIKGSVYVEYDIKGNDIDIDTAILTMTQNRGLTTQTVIQQEGKDWIVENRGISLIVAATEQREPHIKHEYEAM